MSHRQHGGSNNRFHLSTCLFELPFFFHFKQLKFLLLLFSLNRRRNIPAKRYKNGVSIAATNSLKMPPKRDPKTETKVKRQKTKQQYTVAESIICEAKVEVIAQPQVLPLG